MTTELIVLKTGLSGWIFFHFLIFRREKIIEELYSVWNNRRLIGGYLYSLVLARGLFLKRFPSLLNMSPKHLTGIKYINMKHFGPLWNLLYTHESPKTTIFSYSIIQGGQWGLEDYGTTFFKYQIFNTLSTNFIDFYILPSNRPGTWLSTQPDFHVRSLLISECGLMKKLKWGSVYLFFTNSLYFVVYLDGYVQRIFKIMDFLAN